MPLVIAGSPSAAGLPVRGRVARLVPMSRFHVWRRRIVIAIACLPLATAGVLHKMGRSGDFGILGRWYVMAALTAAGVLAWLLLEKAIARTTPTDDRP
jgi:hypothetical protein